MDPAVNNIHTQEEHDPATDFVQSMISSLPGAGPVERSREAHRQWYESLSEENQMKVRDRLREEIARVRAQFGKRSSAVATQPFQLRDHG